MSGAIKNGAAAAPAAMIPECPNCGKRNTFKRERVQLVEVSRVEVTTYACTRCGFRWVSLRHLTDGDTASGAAGKGGTK